MNIESPAMPYNFVDLEPETLAECAHKSLIAIGLGTAQAVVDVNEAGEADRQRLGAHQIPEEPREGHRVGAARDCDSHAVSGLEDPFSNHMV